MPGAQRARVDGRELRIPTDRHNRAKIKINLAGLGHPFTSEAK
jgi:hypothetical protein